MPLLLGKFDPLRLNATQLAALWTESEGGWQTETERIALVDRFQALLDQLWHTGVIK